MKNVSIFYDGECPFCRFYVRAVRLRETVGEFRLVDLRKDAKARQTFQSRGYNLDKGFIVQINNEVYFGPEGIHILALMTSPIGFFNRLCSLIFAHRALAVVFYPILAFGRSVTLLALGVSSLREKDSQ